MAQLLAKEGLSATRNGIAKLIKEYKWTGTIRFLPGAGQPSIITPEMKEVVDQQIEKDDKTTATQLYALLKDRGFRVSKRTVLRCWCQLSWTFIGSE